MTGGIYAERRPSRLELRPQVRAAWTCVAPGTEAEGITESVRPDGCVDLVWSNGQLLAVGPDTGARYVPVRRGEQFAGLRLESGAARLLLGDLPAREIQDRQVDLAELSATQTNPISPARSGAGPADRLATSTTRQRT